MWRRGRKIGIEGLDIMDRITAIIALSGSHSRKYAMISRQIETYRMFPLYFECVNAKSIRTILKKKYEVSLKGNRVLRDNARRADLSLMRNRGQNISHLPVDLAVARENRLVIERKPRT